MLVAYALGREVPRNSMITQLEVSHIWSSRCMDMRLKMGNTCFSWTVVLVPEERFLKGVQLRQLLVSSSYLLTHGLPSTCNGSMNVCIIFVALPKANQARQMAWLLELQSTSSKQAIITNSTSLPLSKSQFDHRSVWQVYQHHCKQ